MNIESTISWLRGLYVNYSYTDNANINSPASPYIQKESKKKFKINTPGDPNIYYEDLPSRQEKWYAVGSTNVNSLNCPIRSLTCSNEASDYPTPGESCVNIHLNI